MYGCSRGAYARQAFQWRLEAAALEREELRKRKVPKSTCGCGGPCCGGQAGQRAAGPVCYSCACVSERDGRLWIRGRAAQYEVFSTTINEHGREFREVISRGAFAAALRKPDRLIRATVGHDPELTLASSPGNLEVWEDASGLHFRFPVPESRMAELALEGIRSGRLGGCSFQMSEVESTFEETTGGLVRRISRVGELHDVSLVRLGAYSVAAPEPAAARAWDELRLDEPGGLDRLFEAQRRRLKQAA